jgi:hypothetical protein
VVEGDCGDSENKKVNSWDGDDRKVLGKENANYKRKGIDGNGCNSERAFVPVKCQLLVLLPGLLKAKARLTTIACFWRSIN